jgi:lipoprotein-anchoring transpeptidase ErfK/SrfK
MPYMQMYDSKGIAFHAGPNPGYPASHGCVRLPKPFAEKLFGLTKIGTEIIIEG